MTGADVFWLFVKIKELQQKNEFLEKAHKTNIKIAENIKEERNQYKSLVESQASVLEDFIDERVKASQNLEKKNIEIETAKKEAERLQIEAKGIAEYNETISKSLTKELIQKQALEKWDGKLPQVSGDNGTLIDIPLNNK